MSLPLAFSRVTGGEVLPGGEKPNIVAGFARELSATSELLIDLTAQRESACA